eukprot:1293489-Prorocentrum_lima.AAC.1
MALDASEAQECVQRRKMIGDEPNEQRIVVTLRYVVQHNPYCQLAKSAEAQPLRPEQPQQRVQTPWPILLQQE